MTYLPFPNVPIGLLPSVQAAILERKLVRELTRLRSSFPFDLIHAYQLFPSGYVAVRLARRFGVPVVVSAVGSDVHTHPHRHPGIRRRSREAALESDEITAVSAGLASQLEDLAGGVRSVRVVYGGVDTEQFAPVEDVLKSRRDLGLPSGGLGICSVGRLVRAKGFLELLDAFESLLQTYPDAWLTLVGDGPLRAELEERVHGGSLRGKVHLPGARPQSEVAKWVGAADVFVLASHAEGLPNAVLEAMACGRPVVATDVGGVSEAVADGGTGILVPREDERSLRDALSRLMASAPLRQRMGEAGRTRVLSSFGWEKSGADTLAVYSDVLRVAHSDAAARADNP